MGITSGSRTNRIVAAMVYTPGFVLLVSFIEKFKTAASLRHQQSRRSVCLEHDAIPVPWMVVLHHGKEREKRSNLEWRRPTNRIFSSSGATTSAGSTLAPTITESWDTVLP